MNEHTEYFKVVDERKLPAMIPHQIMDCEQVDSTDLVIFAYLSYNDCEYLTEDLIKKIQDRYVFEYNEVRRSITHLKKLGFL